MWAHFAPFLIGLFLQKLNNSSGKSDFLMDTFQDAHYFSLPTQGNVYTFVNLSLTNGSNKALIAILKRKVYCCEFSNDNDGILKPIVKEVPFTYIPTGAEIISIDAFNRSKTRDDFFIGIAIIKVASDQSAETYLNVYTEQDIDERGVLSLENIAQNCLISELTFTPYQLYHTYLFQPNGNDEVVWLLSGSDMKVHLFREDPQNHTYCEAEVEELFPEFSSPPSIILWMNVKHSSDLSKRITAFGCECGIVKLFITCCETTTVLRTFTEQYDAPISRVHLFTFNSGDIFPISDIKRICSENPMGRAETVSQEQTLHLLVVNSLQPSIVFMNIMEKGLTDKNVLPDSDKHDATLCCCSADIDFDGTPEILLGTYAKDLLVYKYKYKWILVGQNKFSHGIHSINYIDVTEDGVNELIVVTMAGIHILQHNPLKMLHVFNAKLTELLENYSPDETEKSVLEKITSCDDIQSGASLVIDTEESFTENSGI